MKSIVEFRTDHYSPRLHGTFRWRRRLTRLYISERRSTDRPLDPGQEYRQILPNVYSRMVRSPEAPVPMPEKIRAEWSDDEWCFILHGKGLTGFSVSVIVETVRSDQDVPLSDSERRNPGRKVKV